MRIRVAALALVTALAPCAASRAGAACAPPQDPPAGRRPRRRRRARPADPALRPGHHQGGQVGRGRLHRAPDQGPALLRDPEGTSSARSSSGSARSPRRRSASAMAARPSGNRVVRWERRGDRILLRSVSYDVVADAPTPIAQAVQAANNDSILDGLQHRGARQGRRPGDRRDAAVHDRRPGVQRPRPRLRARSFDAVALVRRARRRRSPRTSRSRPRTPTTRRPISPGRRRAGARRPRPRRRHAGTGSATVVMHYSMVHAAREADEPRLFDERVGYFSVRQMDYGKDEHRAPERRYITRWRLEKKDPNAALSEPVKPIVY